MNPDHPSTPTVPPLPYSPADLADDWEFKVIRSQLGLFARRDFRDRVLAEEGRSGWVLLEKLDDNLLRLKRRRKAHPDPEVADIDPYRSVVDAAERSRQSWRENWLSCLAILILPVLIAGVISWFRK